MPVVGLYFIISGIKKNSSWRAVFGVFILVLSFILFFSVGQAHADFTENFDDLATGDLNGQGGWSVPTNPSDYDIIGSGCRSANNCGYRITTTGSDYAYVDIGENIENGEITTISFYIKADTDNARRIGLAISTSTAVVPGTARFNMNTYKAGCSINTEGASGYRIYGSATSETFASGGFASGSFVFVELEINSLNHTCRARGNSGAWRSSLSYTTPVSDMKYLMFSIANGATVGRIDDIFVDTVAGWAGDGTQNLSEIQITQPTVGSTTASKTFNYEITGALDSAFAPDYVDRITVSFCSLTVPEDDCEYDTPFLEGTDFDWDSSFQLTGTMTVDNSALYLMTASFVGEECDFWLFCEDRVYKADMVQFMVASTTATAEEIIDALQGPQAVLNACEDQDAGWVSALTGGALCKVLTFLFYPSTPSWSKATSTIQLLKSRAPFGYFYQLKTGYENITLTASTTPTLTLVLPASVGGNLTILSESNIKLYMGTSTFNLLYSFVEFVLWVMFGFYIFRRVSGLANNVSSK